MWVYICEEVLDEIIVKCLAEPVWTDKFCFIIEIRFSVAP